MSLTIELSPEEETRLRGAAAAEGIALQDYVRRTLTGTALTSPGHAPAIDAENAAAIALLQYFLDQEATDDPQVMEAAQKDLDDLKQNLDANRANVGDRLLFPS